MNTAADPDKRKNKVADHDKAQGDTDKPAHEPEHCRERIAGVQMAQAGDDQRQDQRDTRTLRGEPSPSAAEADKVDRKAASDAT